MSHATDAEYVVRVHNDDDGSLWAEVLDLPGCFASGSNFDELLEALREAISLYVADDPAAGRPREPYEPPDRSMRVDEMRIKVAA